VVRLPLCEVRRSPFDSRQVALVGPGSRRSLHRAACEASPTWNPSRRYPASLELQERIANGLERRYIGRIMLTVDQVVELVKSGHGRFAQIHAAAMVLVQADVDQREVDRHLQKARRMGKVIFDREQGWRVK